MMIQPATWDDSKSVEASDASLGKKRGQNVANNTADSMGGKNLDENVM
jgi:hypothetical protein